MNVRIAVRVGGAALALISIGSAWIFLMPVPFGRASYVVTSGISMQPLFHAGDLAVVRAADDYQVGDVVAYRSRYLHTIVLHRIVAREGDRYLFKGDNNDFVDPEQPMRSQLVGTLWLRVPHAGTILRTLPIAGLLAGLAVLLLLGNWAGARRESSHRRDSDKNVTSKRRPPLAAQNALPAALFIASGALIASLVLAVASFTRPTQGAELATAAYTQSGALNYSAPAPRGAVYPNGWAQTGEPIFVRLVHKVPVRFDYHLSSRFPHTLGGSATIEAEIASSNGWKRTLGVQRTTRFTGNHGSATRTLDLRKIGKLMRRVEAATAVTGGATYTLTLVPRIRINGQLAGAHLSAAFAPRIPFTLELLELRPELPSGTTLASTPGQPASPSPLNPSSAGSVETTHTAARTFSFHGVQLTVTRAREIATLGAAVTLSALLALILLALRGHAGDEPSRIQARYGHLLIPVTRTERHSWDEVVEIGSFETLARLADRYDRVILHEQYEHHNSYCVADKGILYCYLIGSADGIPHFETATHASEPSRRSTRGRQRSR
jgi:signal peptidase I